MTPPRALLVVRHGQSVANAGGITMAHADIPLTALGEQQAQQLALRLPVDPARILASPYVRARDTAAPYARRTGRPADPEPLLHEFDMIDPDGIAGMDQAQRRPIAEAWWQQADPDARHGAHAESFRSFAGRVATFRTQRLPTLPHGTVCFGHGTWLGMLLLQLQGYAVTDSASMADFRRIQRNMPLTNGVVVRVTQTVSDPDTWQHSFCADDEPVRWMPAAPR